MKRPLFLFLLLQLNYFDLKFRARFRSGDCLSSEHVSLIIIVVVVVVTPVRNVQILSTSSFQCSNFFSKPFCWDNSQCYLLCIQIELENFSIDCRHSKIERTNFCRCKKVILQFLPTEFAMENFSSRRWTTVPAHGKST